MPQDIHHSFFKNTISKTIIENLKNLPKNPGVYEMKNKKNETLYVGKAKNLKSRVKSYFLHSTNHSPRIKKLIETVDHIEWTQTSSEIEALILETNLIKQKNPKFNILMRDDKNFSYIKVSIQEDFPRIFLTRRVLKDGAKYFGPKTSSSAVRKTIDLLQDIFHFRSSTMEIQEISKGKVNVKKSGNTKLPCLNFHLGKCDAPCIGKISKEEYSKKISASIAFLKGNYKEILQQIQEKMMEYAKDGKFELAAKMRDRMFAIKNISEKQIISTPDEFSADIIGTYHNFGHLFFHLFSVREGKIINSETFFVQLNLEEETQDSYSLREYLFSFLRSHPERVADSPKVIVLNAELFGEENKEIWEKFFLQKFGHKTEISLPQKAKRKKLLELAEKNAENYAKRHSASFLKNSDNSEEVLQILQNKLQMKTIPKRIECYDISHFSGQKTIASMVVFENGKAKNSDYRSFNIQTLKKGEIDDFASLEEALLRRLHKLPDIFPENFEVKKLKTKKDFSSQKNISLFFPQKYNSEIYLNTQKNLEKKIESNFFSLVDKNKKDKNIIENLFTRKNTITKTGEIYYQPSFVSLNNTISIQKFFLTTVFQKLKCTEYFVYINPQNAKISNMLESLGFSEVSHSDHYKKFSGRYYSQKNDSFSKIPDLILIDGGKGQLSCTAKVLLQSPYAEKITICSIAKKEEKIFIFKSKNAEICLTNIQKNSPEGHLLQNIRNEAHRFAITKNRIGREKIGMKSILDEIKGLGPKTKKILKQKGGIPAIKKMSDDELRKIVSEKVFIQLREKL